MLYFTHYHTLSLNHSCELLTLYLLSQSSFSFLDHIPSISLIYSYLPLSLSNLSCLSSFSLNNSLLSSFFIKTDQSSPLWSFHHPYSFTTKFSLLFYYIYSLRAHQVLLFSFPHLYYTPNFIFLVYWDKFRVSALSVTILPCIFMTNSHPF